MDRSVEKEGVGDFLLASIVMSGGGEFTLSLSLRHYLRVESTGFAIVQTISREQRIVKKHQSHLPPSSSPDPFSSTLQLLVEHSVKQKAIELRTAWIEQATFSTSAKHSPTELCPLSWRDSRATRQDWERPIWADVGWENLFFILSLGTMEEDAGSVTTGWKW